MNSRAIGALRALDALHVYCHTSAYYHLLLKQNGFAYSNEEFLKASLKSHFERANYLYDALSLEICYEHFDTDGVIFFDWLNDVLKQIRIADGYGKNILNTIELWSPDDIQRYFH